MELQLRSLLDTFQRSRPGERTYFPVKIPAPRLEALVEAVRRRALASADKSTEVDRNIDFLLDDILVECANAEFLIAEEKVFKSFSENFSECVSNIHMFRQFLEAFFIVQRIDIVRDLISIFYNVPFNFTLRIDDNGPGIGRVRWDNKLSGDQVFTFDSAVLGQIGSMRLFCDEFLLFVNYINSGNIETGSIIHNHWDLGLTPGLAYSDSRPGYFLVPDYVFVSTKGYEYARTHFQNNIVKWHDRKPVAFWRGSTTGICLPGQWRSLERIRLCEIARENNQTGLFDVGLSEIAQIDDLKSIKEIEESGLLLGRISWEKWNKYKYHIDIDGNSSPWSNLFQKLLTGSPVLKVESYRKLKQWYYEELVPWNNFIPVKADMSDLVEKVKWVHDNDSAAEEIGKRGLELANKLTYRSEMARSVETIASAFRYFNGGKKFSIVTEADDQPSNANIYGVPATTGSKGTDAIINFLQYLEFDLDQYLADNQDLKGLNFGLQEVVDHLIFHGFREGRKIPVAKPKLISEALAVSQISSEGKGLIRSIMGNFRLSISGIIREYLNREGPFSLEIGAGPILRQGWLSTDLHERDADENTFAITLDATKPFPLPSDSFDYIYSEHMIEHVSFKDGQVMLAEAQRVLKSGGVVRIATPSIAMLMRVMSPNRSALEDAYLMHSVQANVPDAPIITNAFFLNNFMRNWGHTFIYDHDTLRLALEMAGFRDVRQCVFRESTHPTLRGLENEDRMPPGFLELETMVFEGTK